MEVEQLLAEIEDIIRTRPSRDAFGHGDDDNLPWVGRAVAAIQRWDIVYLPHSNRAAQQLSSDYMADIASGYSELNRLLHQALSDLRMEVGPLSVAVASGQSFAYFDEVRKKIESARTEVFFVDPYLDADFVSKYLPHVKDGVIVRLLGRKGMPALVSAVAAFAAQSHLTIQVRSSSDLHDRYLFVDKTECYLSGASFNHGAQRTATVITQITDAFPAMWTTYEQCWSAAKQER